MSFKTDANDPVKKPEGTQNPSRSAIANRQAPSDAGQRPLPAQAKALKIAYWETRKMELSGNIPQNTIAAADRVIEEVSKLNLKEDHLEMLNGLKKMIT